MAPSRRIHGIALGLLPLILDICPGILLVLSHLDLEISMVVARDGIPVDLLSSGRWIGNRGYSGAPYAACDLTIPDHLLVDSASIIESERSRSSEFRKHL